MLRFEVNETEKGVVAPNKNLCKVKGCNGGRFKSRRGHAFCKRHSGLKSQMPKTKFRELMGNNELVVIPEKIARKGLTSKKNKWRVIKNKILKGG